MKRQSAIFFAALWATVLVSLTSVLAGSVSIDLVHVGDPGNANDSNDGDSDTTGVQHFGSVSYSFNIAKYDVTLNQYCAFLNAVAASDPNNLYNPAMATDLNVAGISRTGSNGSFMYSVIGSGQRPVTYVSWYDACRFCNWLTNGQPTGPQGSGTTETGIYTLSGPTSISGTLPATHSALVASGTPKWFLPTENEWYKVAYYNPAGANYFLYPFRTNTNPTVNNPALLDSHSGNFYNGVYAVSQTYTNPPIGNMLTDVGAYVTTSSYGSYDMGGDVTQWEESLVSSGRGRRGGYWDFLSGSSASYFRDYWTPAGETNDMGFRVAELPEPSSIALFALGTIGVVFTARRKMKARVA